MCIPPHNDAVLRKLTLLLHAISLFCQKKEIRVKKTLVYRDRKRKVKQRDQGKRRSLHKSNTSLSSIRTGKNCARGLPYTEVRLRNWQLQAEQRCVLCSVVAQSPSSKCTSAHCGQRRCCKVQPACNDKRAAKTAFAKSWSEPQARIN